MDNSIAFKNLNVFDVFQIDTEDYYIKINPTSGFNSILLTGKEIDCSHFDDETKVEKFVR